MLIAEPPLAIQASAAPVISAAASGTVDTTVKATQLKVDAATEKQAPSF